jgi:hypothetical protein
MQIINRNNPVNLSRVQPQSKNPAKEVVTTADGLKIIFESSNPWKLRAWTLVPGTAHIIDAFGDDKTELAESLEKRAAHLSRIIPVREKAFAAIDRLIKEKFTSPLFGYEFLNDRQKEWRSSDTRRLHELIEVLEKIEQPEPVYSDDCENVCKFCGRYFVSDQPEIDCGACEGQTFAEAA